jgi:hypothetical protein
MAATAAPAILRALITAFQVGKEVGKQSANGVGVTPPYQDVAKVRKG